MRIETEETPRQADGLGRGFLIGVASSTVASLVYDLAVWLATAAGTA